MQRTKKHKWVSLVAVPFVFLCGAAYSQQPAQLTAREIIERVISTYTSCRSYSDEGETTVTNVKSRGGRNARFTTAYVRQVGFRFRLNASSGVGESVVWKDAGVEKYWTERVGGSEAPLDDGLARLAFFSGAASLTVPTLLLPDIFMGRGLLDSFDEPKLTGTETIDGRQAFIIEGKKHGQIAKLWIDQSSFLILKTYRRARGPILEEDVTTKYKPAVNIEVAAEKLTFNPPPEKAAPQPKSSESASAGPQVAATARLTLPDHIDSSSAPRLGRFGESLRMNAAQIERLRRKKYSGDEEDVIRVDTDLVVSEVEVLDKNGAPIVGLLAEDFIIKEDGQAQEISSFSIGDASNVPRSIVLILDYSASELPYIRTSVDSAKMLVDKLNPKDRMAIVSDDVKLLVDFTTDKEMLKANLELLRKKALAGKVGRSAQYDALIVTLRELFSEEDLRPIVIFQTDGDQLSLLKNETTDIPDPYLLSKNYGIEDLKTAAEKARATVYSIIPGVRFVGFSEDEQIKRAELDAENRRKAFAELAGRSSSSAPRFSPERYRTYAANWLRRQLALVDLATSTGGWPGYLEQPEQADEIYARILSDLNRRYVIGYYPKNRAKDGKRRTVTIEVRDHPEYVVSGRKAYYAPQPE